MDILEAIESRRSVKHFDPAHEMTDAEIDSLIELAKLAPSSFNIQNYRFVVVKDRDLRQRVRNVAWNQAQVTDASLLIIMCADLKSYASNPARYWAHAPKSVQDVLVPAMIPFYKGNPQLERDEAMRSTGLAGMTLMLAARGMGYDSCPMVGFDPDAVARLIRLPQDHVISFMISIGKAIQPAWPRGERIANSEAVITDRFDPQYTKRLQADPLLVTEEISGSDVRNKR